LALSVLAVAVGQAMFPSMSEHAAAGRNAELAAFVSTGVRSIVIITMPVAATLFVASGPITALIYERGSFDATATAQTANAVRVLAVGLPFEAVYAILLGYFYAVRDYRSLTLAGTLSFAAKVTFGLAFGLTWGWLGLAASTALAAFAKTAIVGIRLNNPVTQGVGWRAIGFLMVKTGLSVIPGAFAAFWLIEPVSRAILSATGRSTLSGVGTVMFLGGILATSYTLTAALLGVRCDDLMRRSGRPLR